ncbi:MAG TPA: hypothetical protein VF453_04325 [Burkholderiaceae bacterium]
MPHRSLALAAALALAGLACGARAEPAEALKPLAFLAGHCWKGTFADGQTTDEHCFRWLYDGHVLRDTHVVRAPGRPDAVGESTYYVNPAAGRVEFLYVENAGGISRGTVEALPEALIFPDTQYTGDGEAVVYRARWTPVSPDAYEAWSEAQTPDGWTTMFRIVLRRAD